METYGARLINTPGKDRRSQAESAGVNWPDVKAAMEAVVPTIFILCTIFEDFGNSSIDMPNVEGLLFQSRQTHH
jgi:hypothetical protein